MCSPQAKDRSNKSNKKDRKWLHFQTPRIAEFKMRRVAAGVLLANFELQENVV